MPDGNDSRVEVVGLERAMRDLTRWSLGVGPVIESKGRSFATSVASRTASTVPRVSGALAASIHVVPVEGVDAGWGVSEGDGLKYAGWIEFGGSRGRPRVPEGRYLYPIATGAQDQWVSLAEAAVDQTTRSFPWANPQ